MQYVEVNDDDDDDDDMGENGCLASCWKYDWSEAFVTFFFILAAIFGLYVLGFLFVLALLTQ